MLFGTTRSDSLIDPQCRFVLAKNGLGLYDNSGKYHMESGLLLIFEEGDPKASLSVKCVFIPAVSHRKINWEEMSHVDTGRLYL